MTTSKEILRAIEKNFQKVENLQIRNSSDLNIDTKVKHVYQYIIGVTNQDHLQVSFDEYKYRMKKRIKEDVVCCGWPYQYDEINELKIVLRELSDYYEADLDIETMINSLPKKDAMKNIQYCYLVITVVPIQLIYVNPISN